MLFIKTCRTSTLPFISRSRDRLTVEKYVTCHEALNVAMEGRYGKNGSHAAFKWLQEQNPSNDPTILQNCNR
jgi:hypothetical protein